MCIKDTYRGIVHILRRHRQIVGQRKDDAYEQRPQDTVDVGCPPEETVAHVKRSRLEVDLRMVPIIPPPFRESSSSVSAL